MKVYIDAELSRHICGDWAKWNDDYRKKYIDAMPAVLIHDGNGIMKADTTSVSVGFCPYCGQRLETDEDGRPVDK